MSEITMESALGIWRDVTGGDFPINQLHNEKRDHGRISPELLKPSPENDNIYDSSHDLDKFAERLRREGVHEPIVCTRDYFIVSGHRRRAAAMLAGLDEVPYRMLPQFRSDFTTEEYIKLLREYNFQRKKTFAESARECAIDADPELAHAEVIERLRKTRKIVGAFEIEGGMHRIKTSRGKMPFLEAAEKVIYELEEFWPLSIRGIHYPLLNAPPLIHASKPGSTYKNTMLCYKR